MSQTRLSSTESFLPCTHSCLLALGGPCSWSLSWRRSVGQRDSENVRRVMSDMWVRFSTRAPGPRFHPAPQGKLKIYSVLAQCEYAKYPLKIMWKQNKKIKIWFLFCRFFPVSPHFAISNVQHGSNYFRLQLSAFNVKLLIRRFQTVQPRQATT